MSAAIPPSLDTMPPSIVMNVATSSSPSTIPTNILLMSAAKQLQTELARVGSATFTSSHYKQGTVKHIVLFRYAKNVTSAEKEEIKTRFLNLQQQAKRNGVPYIQSITTGQQSSGEEADGGFEQGFIVTFASEGDRNYYVGTPIVTDPRYYDPAHAAFKEFVGPFLLPEKNKGVLVFDFNAQDMNMTAPLSVDKK